MLQILNCPELDLILLATNTVSFIDKFIQYSSIKNLEDVIDPEFKLLHVQLVKTFCEAASKETAIGTEQSKSRIAGLKALESLCHSNYFVDGSKIDSNVEIVLVSILGNLKSVEKKDSTLERAFPSMQELPRQSISDQLFSANEMNQTAERCLSGMFKNTNASTLKTLFSTLFKILDDSGQLENSKYLLDILPIIVTNTQSQYHFVIISVVLEKVNTEARINQKTTAIKALAFLIASGRLAGMTIPELLDTCVKHLKSVTSDKQIPVAERKPIQNALINAVGISN